MNKAKLYTAVPLSRLKSIAKYGLLPNDRLMEVLSENQTYPELKGRIFEESDFGYIYASKNVFSTLQWASSIQMMTNDFCAILSYEVEEELIELDLTSSNNDLSDCKFNKIIKPEDITFIVGEISVINGDMTFKASEMPFAEFFEQIKEYTNEQQNFLMETHLKIKVNIDKEPNVIHI